MKLKAFTGLLIGILMAGFAAYGTLAKTSVVVKNDKSSEDTDGGGEKKPQRTKFAINSIEANQILLMTRKPKVVSN